MLTPLTVCTVQTCAVPPAEESDDHKTVRVTIKLAARFTHSQHVYTSVLGTTTLSSAPTEYASTRLHSIVATEVCAACLRIQPKTMPLLHKLHATVLTLFHVSSQAVNSFELQCSHAMRTPATLPPLSLTLILIQHSFEESLSHEPSRVSTAVRRRYE